MSLYEAETIGCNILENILIEIQQQIDIIEIIKYVPKYLHQSIFQEITGNLDSLQPNYQIRSGIIKQQFISNIPTLQRDTLMPKQLVIQLQPINQFQRTSKILSPKAKVTKRRSTVLSSTMKSIQLSDKKSIQIGQKNKKSQNFIQLKLQKQQDNLQKIRNKKQVIYQQQLKQILLNKKKQQQLKQKIQQFNTIYQQQDYTFNFQGQIISSTIDHGRIKNYGLRLNLGAVKKSIRDDFKKTKQLSNSIDLKQKKKQPIPAENIIATDQIPIFSQLSQRTSYFGVPAQLGQCKLNEYKKYYGGRFHRLEKSMIQTLDHSRKQSIDNQQDLFTSKRSIKDQQSLKQSLVINHKNQGHPRKLALPKLKGVYKVLDRYENAD